MLYSSTRKAVRIYGDGRRQIDAVLRLHTWDADGN